MKKFADQSLADSVIAAIDKSPWHLESRTMKGWSFAILHIREANAGKTVRMDEFMRLNDGKTHMVVVYNEHHESPGKLSYYPCENGPESIRVFGEVYNNMRATLDSQPGSSAEND